MWHISKEGESSLRVRNFVHSLLAVFVSQKIEALPHGSVGTPHITGYGNNMKANLCCSLDHIKHNWPNGSPLVQASPYAHQEANGPGDEKATLQKLRNCCGLHIPLKTENEPPHYIGLHRIVLLHVVHLKN